VLADRRIRPDDLTEARAVDVGHGFEVQQDVLAIWLTKLFTLSLSSASPSPRTILPFMSSTTTSPTARSSNLHENGSR